MAARILALAGLVLSAAGIFVSATLSLTFLKGAVVPCGGGSGCAVVASSEYSRFLGLPLGYWGFAGYSLLFALGALSLVPRWSSATVRIAWLVALAGTVASGVLMYLSFVVIQATCLWCLASAITMALLLMDLTLRQRRADAGIRPLAGSVVSLLLLSGALAAAVYVERNSMRSFINQSALQATDFAELADPAAPSTGSSKARIVLVEFADFACPACRDVHQRLGSLLSHFDGIRLVYRHFPQPQLTGHEASVYGAACSALAAEKGKFWEFADLAFAGPPHPGRADYEKMLGRLGLGVRPGVVALSPGDPAVRRVEEDRKLGHRLGILLTPVFVVFSPERRPLATTNVDLAAALERPEIATYLRKR